jgi:hypothetical protein
VACGYGWAPEEPEPPVQPQQDRERVSESVGLSSLTPRGVRLESLTYRNADSGPVRREFSPRVGSLTFKKMAEPVWLRDNSAADGVRAFRVFCGQVPVTVSVRAAVLTARRTIF